MAYQTPPASGRKNTLLGAANRLPYYEDVRGKLNSDEEFDRFPDECETESSSSDSERPSERERTQTRKGFLKGFATPNRSSSRVNPGSDRFGESKNDAKNFFRQFSKPGRANSSSCSSASSIDTPSPSAKKASKGPSKARTQSTVKSNSNQIGNERSVPARLTPRNFGMFDGHERISSIIHQDITPRKSTGQNNEISSFFEEAMAPIDYPITNVAGKIMDDLLRGGAPYNLEDSFPTLEKDTSSSESIVNDVESPAEAADVDSQAGQNIEEVDLEAEMDKLINEKAKPPQSKKLGTELVAVRQKTHRQPLVQSAKRRSTRQEAMQAKKATKKQPGRHASCVQHANDKALNLKAANHGKMTERAASLRSKAQKGIATRIPKKSAGKLHDKAKPAKVDRNWKGEEVDLSSAMVVVLTDEDDADEYVRY